jgi:hypothetical protein
VTTWRLLIVERSASSFDRVPVKLSGGGQTLGADVSHHPLDRLCTRVATVPARSNGMSDGDRDFATPITATTPPGRTSSFIRPSAAAVPMWWMTVLATTASNDAGRKGWARRSPAT